MNAMIAPELSSTLNWVNSPPVRIGDCRGSAVALVFWSAGSPYCHNVLERLRHIHARFPSKLRVLAIHTPKFDAERDADAVRRAASRLRVEFPVVHDPDFVAWQHYGIQAWPTVVVIDGNGKVRESLAGDGGGDRLLATIEAAANECEAEPPEGFPKTNSPTGDGVLSFPSGLAMSDTRLYIADGGHHRILECTHEGRVVRVFGSGHPDLVDGAHDEAAFHRPQGLAIIGNQLYIADTGNHALRRLGLHDGHATTLVGNGSSGEPREGRVGEPRTAALDAPWAVAGDQDRLFIAMAGRNQIWEYALGAPALRCFAGSGQLGVQDGAAGAARFAHPAALCLLQKTLYVADAGGSAVRSVNIDSGKVQTLVGQGLYEFGDKDGKRKAARLQHPLGLAIAGDPPQLWIADSYNASIKRLKLGGGGLSHAETAQTLRRPTAMCFGADALWIADTDAHAVLRLDVASGHVRVLDINE